VKPAVRVAANVTSIVAVALATASACGGDETTDAPIVESGGIAVLDAWTRPTPTSSEEAAIYVTIENRAGPDDRFVGADSERCMVMHPHLTEIDDEGVASMTTADDDQLALTVGGTLTMEPAGLHIMCLGLDEPLAAGDTFDVELRFGDHDPVSVPVAVEQR
jgi:copper(I)-binding protein